MAKKPNKSKKEASELNSKTILETILANQSPDAFTMGPVYAAIENSPLNAITDIPDEGFDYVEAVMCFVPDLGPYDLRYSHAAMMTLLQSGNITAVGRPDKPHHPFVAIPRSAWRHLKIIDWPIFQYFSLQK